MKVPELDFYQRILELIDMRSFSNLWYWIMLVAVWTMASHWVLGVPFDLVMRARREGGQAQVDLEDSLRVNINRMEHILGVAGPWGLGFTCFILTTLFTLATFYRFEFAAAVLLMLLPLTLVTGLSIAAARQIRREEATGELLHKRLSRHRIYTQIIGMISIFVTAIVGMTFLFAHWSV